MSLLTSGVGLTGSGEAVEAESRQDQAEPCNPAHPSFPTLQEQAAYWQRKEQEERTGGVNDFIEEEQQYSNYSEEQL